MKTFNQTFAITRYNTLSTSLSDIDSLAESNSSSIDGSKEKHPERKKSSPINMNICMTEMAIKDAMTIEKM